MRDRQYYLDVYAILVSVCGATNRPGDADTFAHHMAAGPDDRGDEWRFGGTLGFGGKAKREGELFHVTCYVEDETPERLTTCKTADALLLDLYRKDMWTLGFNFVDTYHPSFEAAFRALYAKAKEPGAVGGWQVLETCIWIKPPGKCLPLSFYRARDRACDMGLLVDGKLVPER